MAPLDPHLAREPVEERKEDALDKELLMKLKMSQLFVSTNFPFENWLMYKVTCLFLQNKYPSRIKSDEKPRSGTQVAFGQGNSYYARNFPMPKKDSSAGGASKLPKEYAEPWDYSHDYPVTLPLRKPYSGNPEILDEEEFGESSASRTQDDELSAAEQLGLMDMSSESQFLFFQLPSSLPLPRQPQSGADPNEVRDEKREDMRPSSHNGSKLKEVPEGYMGKMLVYKSGKVKMKIGDTLFDVSFGSNCMFSQEVAAINIREKHCCTVGEISKRAIITPDINYMLGSVDKMEE
ncbi:DNA-directed RNA polymerase III subunit RPC4 [Zea mays]|uniref:RNA polymerase III RPC4 n=3 Tax=Zea mays TaxID=4577 RepID=A0A1D6ECB3_MAIZE|nr:RNA polymerase III RPC4 [Zea mays]ONM17964.1 RNA polymerase III RPC4 [Zea mays]ONM17966.1 RNA polymerase III RPC4 [Zea mays]PWZ39250.1 DNA-directed RNA polymerase III subunit RPC4 [Zea mays]